MQDSFLKYKKNSLQISMKKTGNLVQKDLKRLCIGGYQYLINNLINHRRCKLKDN